jgi:hypothetical protein
MSAKDSGESPAPKETTIMSHIPTNHRARGDKAWGEATILQAEIHALYRKAKALEHEAIISWSMAEVLEMAKATDRIEPTEEMIAEGARIVEAKLGQVSSAELADAVFLAMMAARP